MEQAVATGFNNQGISGDERRVWKIGTYSMGLTLIGIGLAFAASLWQTTSAYQLLLWLAPIVFIVLGIELMVVHSERFLRRYKLQYNWIAVWFVGFIGAGALMLAALLSSGVLEEVNQAFHVQERYAYIEERESVQLDSIEKVIVSSSIGYQLERHSALDEVILLGTLYYEADRSIQLTEQKLLRTSQVGNVLYVFIQGIEYERNLFAHTGLRGQLILNVPEHVIVEEI